MVVKQRSKTPGRNGTHSKKRVWMPWRIEWESLAKPTGEETQPAESTTGQRVNGGAETLSTHPSIRVLRVR